MAVEEQGRKTLHAHFLIWIQEWRCLLSRLYNSLQVHVQNNASKELAEYLDLIMSTKLYDPAYPKEAFSHECTLENPPETVPVEPQELQDLWHKTTSKTNEQKIVMVCPVCKTGFSSEQMVLNILNKSKLFKGLKIKEFPDKTSSQLLQLAIAEYQYGKRRVDSPKDKIYDKFLINAYYNLFYSGHVRSYFKDG